MPYKLLGYAVWRGGKWYVRRRFGGGGRRKLALAAVSTAVVAGLVAAQRLPNRD